MLRNQWTVCEAVPSLGQEAVQLKESHHGQQGKLCSPSLHSPQPTGRMAAMSGGAACQCLRGHIHAA